MSSYWRDDLVSFVIGCSFSFESELIEAGIEMRHNTQGRNVSMYLTNVACTPAGSMSGNTVMSMRPIPYNQVVKAVQISGAIPKVHGAPLHIGDPASRTSRSPTSATLSISTRARCPSFGPAA